MTPRPRTAATIILATIAATTPAPAPAQETARDPSGVVSFERDARPVLRKHCGKCHNAERPRGELDLSSYAGVVAGGASGKVAVAGNPEDSPLYTLTAHLEEPRMPPNAAKIPQRDLAILRRWVEGGLRETPDGPAPAGVAMAADPASPAPPEKPAGGLVAPEPLAHASAIAALAVSPVAPIAAVPGHRQVLLFDLSRMELLGALAFPEGDVLALRFSRDGRTLLAAGGVGAESGKAVAFRVGDWARAATVGDEQDAIMAADLGPDGSEVVVGGPGRVVKALALPGGEPRMALRKATDWVTAVGYSPDGLLVAAGDRFGGLFLWEGRTGKEFLSLRGHTRAVNALAWLPGGDRLATAGEDGSVRVWDLHAGSSAACWDAHAGGVLSIDVDPSGRIATGGRDRRVKVWSAAGELVADLGPAADHVTRVAWAADGRGLVAGDWSGEVRAWEPSGASSARLPIPVAASPGPLALVVPELSPARPPAGPTVAISAAAPGPSPADEIEAALASAREAASAAARAVDRLSRLRGRPKGPAEPAALGEARAGLSSLRSALAASPGHDGLRRAVEEAERAVRSLEANRGLPAPASGRGADR